MERRTGNFRQRTCEPRLYWVWVPTRCGAGRSRLQTAPAVAVLIITSGVAAIAEFPLQQPPPNTAPPGDRRGDAEGQSTLRRRPAKAWPQAAGFNAVVATHRFFVAGSNGNGTAPSRSSRVWFTQAKRRRKPTRLMPLPAVVPAPAENATTPERVALGKMLFFDPRLSRDNRISCASCHRPEKAFSDGRAVSSGAGGKPLSRNTPSCLNVGYYRNLFWDGRAASLEQQALAPIRSAAEMNQPLDALETELRRIPGYVTAFTRAFSKPPDRAGIARALAAFQRTLVTGPSPFVRFLNGDKRALSADARAGLELFQGEAGCIRCHHGPLLSDGKFYRLGVSFQDAGRGRVTGKREDRFRFRTPSLHQVAETGPYMHNGSLKTLEDVVTFYYRGIPDNGPHGLTPDTTALRGQSFSEIPLLVAFLESLSGKTPAVTPPRLP